MMRIVLALVIAAPLLCSASGRGDSLPKSDLLRQVIELADRDYVPDGAGNFYTRDSEIGRALLGKEAQTRTVAKRAAAEDPYGGWQTWVTFEPGVGPNESRFPCTVPLRDIDRSERLCSAASKK